MKLNKNLISDRDEYTRYLGSFRGVDFSSDPTEVADYRLAEAVNVYKDYRSGQGQAIETIPGFRQVGSSKLEGEIYGIHVYENAGIKKVYIHSGAKLYEASDLNFDSKTTFKEVYWDMNERKSSSFIFNNRIYFLDGKNYIYIGIDGVVQKVIDEAYIPTTHISLNPDGSKYPGAENSGEYGQQNILNSRYKVTYVADGKSNVFSLPLGTDYYLEDPDNPPTSNNGITIKSATGMGDIPGYKAVFPDGDNVQVYQYGVRLPWADPDGNVPYAVLDEDATEILEGEAMTYPNAIKTVRAPGIVELVKAPPLPEKNNCYYSSEYFGFKYSTRGAYPSGYAGIEIMAQKTVNTIKGITSSDTDVGSIITGCTISTVYDGRVILSGNPDYPNIVFYCGRNVDTGYIDPSYFGILDWFSEGVTNTPITALVPVADTLMVLRSDTAQDGSVSFRTPTETKDNVQPLVYKGTSGLSGVGCLGSSCNFLDDPIFISKYGVEAIGRYTSAKYERGIEHRSHLIDGHLLNLDLSKASITEFDGYMWILIEGKIFLADSRQTYTHQSGVMQYEWFYLEDIGIYRGDWDLRVYEDPETKQDIYNSANMISRNKLVSIEEVKKLTNIKRNMGNQVTVDVFEVPSIGDVANAEKETNFSKSTWYDENGNKIVYTDKNGNPESAQYEPYIGTDADGNRVTYLAYTKRTGERVGGTFDPAIEIKAVDRDKLLFGTRTGYIGCFNFDKRDPNDDYKIPNDSYTFNGRRIISGLATKMDNCGIPHLIKNTVKKSMVVKMRTFPTSAAKIKVRTNRLPMREVERIIGGRIGSFDRSDFNFEDLTYETGEKNIFRVREKEKKWLEKQIYFVSDEYRRPFALHHIVYSYVIAGRYKD